MELLIVAGGTILLAIWLAFKAGERKEKLDAHYEVIDDAKRSKELRRRLRNKSFRDKLRNISKKYR